MMTREEVLEIDAYCQEHKMSYRQRLEELDIRFWNFYKAKKKYRLQDEAAATDGNTSGGFVRLGTGGDFVPAMPSSRSNRSTTKYTDVSFIREYSLTSPWTERYRNLGQAVKIFCK